MRSDCSRIEKNRIELNEAIKSCKTQLLLKGISDGPVTFAIEQHLSASLLTCFVKYLAKCCGAQLLATGPPTVNGLCQISMVCFNVKDRLFTQSPFEVGASIFIRFLWALYGTDV